MNGNQRLVRIKAVEVDLGEEVSIKNISLIEPCVLGITMDRNFSCRLKKPIMVLL